MTTAQRKPTWVGFDLRCEFAIQSRAIEAKKEGDADAESMRRSIGQQARFALTEWRKDHESRK